MNYRDGKTKDATDVAKLAKKETGQKLNAQRVAEDIKKYPSEIAEDEKGLIGFALSEEINHDILLVCSLAVKSEQSSGSVGRYLLELIESKATNQGYYSIMVSESVQNSLLLGQRNALMFAGYRDIYSTGGSRLLVKSLR